MRRKESRRNSRLFLPLLFLLVSCSGESARRIRLEIPAPSILHVEEFQGVLLTPFQIAKAPEGFDLNRELSVFFVPEFERKLGLPVTVSGVPPESEESVREPGFWRRVAPGSSRQLGVAGKAEFSREVRKSILGEVPGENPFSPQRKVVERTFFSLSLRLLLIRGDSGEVLFERKFKETQTYSQPGQRTDFALYDLAMRIKDKLFRRILSEGRMQERYLLMK